jgi:hypothetical protein
MGFALNDSGRWALTIFSKMGIKNILEDGHYKNKIFNVWKMGIERHKIFIFILKDGHCKIMTIFKN